MSDKKISVEDLREQIKRVRKMTLTENIRVCGKSSPRGSVVRVGNNREDGEITESEAIALFYENRCIVGEDKKIKPHPKRPRQANAQVASLESQVAALQSQNEQLQQALNAGKQS